MRTHTQFLLRLSQGTSHSQVCLAGLAAGSSAVSRSIGWKLRRCLEIKSVSWCCRQSHTLSGALEHMLNQREKPVGASVTGEGLPESSPLAFITWAKAYKANRRLGDKRKSRTNHQILWFTLVTSHPSLPADTYLWGCHQYQGQLPRVLHGAVCLRLILQLCNMIIKNGFLAVNLITIRISLHALYLWYSF